MGDLSNSQPASKKKIILAWSIMAAFLVFWSVMILWMHRDDGVSPSGGTGEVKVLGSEPSPGGAFDIVGFILGCFFLLLTASVYATTILTDCFTFNFSRPVWSKIRVRLFLVRIVVTTLGMFSVVFLGICFLNPFFQKMGLGPSATYSGPLVIALIVIQSVMIWVSIWAPVERGVVFQRLAAQGISRRELDRGVLIGLSDPGKSSTKRFGAIEEDIGMLWFDPDCLNYRGDNRQFSVTREELIGVDRQTDAGNTTALSGTAHVILCICRERAGDRIRLHTEGVWTMGGKRKSMEALAARIAEWRAGGS